MTVWVALYLVAAISAMNPGFSIDGRGPPNGYTITGNYLSDLGNPAAPAPWAFNLGCILAGLLAIPFGVALGATLPRPWGRAATVLVALGGIALVGVGVFAEGSPFGLHGTFSLAFFLLLTIALAFVLKPFFGSPTFRPVAAWVTVAAFVLSVVLLVTFVANVGNPYLAEHLGVFAGLAWTGTVAVHLWRAPVEAAQPKAAPA